MSDAPADDDPWQALLHHLRRQTGIQPAPLSRAERESGVLALFTPTTAAPSTATPPPATTLAVQGVSLQHLLDYLREQTGIKPIPLSQAERQSGILQAFGAGAPAAPVVPATAAPQSKPAASPASRQELLQRLQANVSPTPPTIVSTTTAPTAPASTHSQPLARYLAAYQKGKRS
jgi:hypothetical protein